MLQQGREDGARENKKLYSRVKSMTVIVPDAGPPKHGNLTIKLTVLFLTIPYHHTNWADILRSLKLKNLQDTDSL